jgi:UDP-glucuronate decarboxylase
VKILVTGGAGFLGSHLSEKLLLLGHDVIVADNLYTGFKSNISNLFEYKNFEFIRHDITLPLFVEVDGIFNLACPASPIHYQKNPVQTLKTSIHGAINMLGLAKRCGARILQASTSEIYGDPEHEIQKEEYWGRVNPIGIRSCYDEGKRAAETLFFDTKRQYGTDTRVARIFNTYGPKMSPMDGRVISNFIVQSIKNEPLTIYGDGSQTRSFCYVEDLIDGLVKMFFLESSNFDLPINLGNPQPVSMKSLAEEILELLPESKSEIVFKALPQDDPLQRCPDINRAINILSWSPKINRKTGLINTIDYFKSILN